jgi:inorganic triphosphatase YgiF
MPRNIEIKAKIPAKFEHNLEEFHRKLTKLCGSSKDCLKQYDTFFNSDNGRLKLRHYPMKIGNGNEKPVRMLTFMIR